MLKQLPNIPAPIVNAPHLWQMNGEAFIRSVSAVVSRGYYYKVLLCGGVWD